MKDFKLDAGAIAPELPVQPRAVTGDLFANLRKEEQEVVCLGQTFPNDAARRAHFTALLAEKLKDPEFRKIEGFPIGKDEDILALSDPPYYCACPNPWLSDFIKEWEAAKPKRKGKYEREPFAADVSEGRSGLFYDAHTYHTKVPHKAIMRYILHYTAPGDIVFDGFCGTGMTGVAAQMCGNRNQIKELGLTIDEDGYVRDSSKKLLSQFGIRHALLNDLSPAASFIAHNFTTKVDDSSIERVLMELLDKAEEKCGWLYETNHVVEGALVGKGRINYVIWSDVLLCPNCSNEIRFYDVSLADLTKGVQTNFNCPHCGAAIDKSSMKHSQVSYIDTATSDLVKENKQVPVLINYTFRKKRYEKVPDEADLQLIDKIATEHIPYCFPTDGMMHSSDPTKKWGDKWRAGSMSVTNVHHFYTKRNLWALSALYDIAKNCEMPQLAFFAISSYNLAHSTKMTRIIFKTGGKKPALTGYQSGALYISSLPIEKNVFTGIRSQKISIIRDSLSLLNDRCVLSTVGMQNVDMPPNSVDYIFVDPPFGSNLAYSELNFIWEAWLKIFTDNKTEAIESEFQHKSVIDYRVLMKECFVKAYKVLKNGHWMTVEFSNTSASIWNSIQTSLSDAGFIIANVSALDKKQGSFNAVTNATSVKQDLVISAYKPDADFEKRFKDEAATEDGVWDFIRTHLEKLPVSKMKSVGGMAHLQVVPERDPRILFDKVVAYYFRNGFPIPISAKEFQEGLRARFNEDDGMFFLPEQHAEYLKQKAKATKLVQAELFVSDESSAIAWLRQKLKEKPQKMQTIQPEFMQQIQAWNKYEQELELRVLLEQNFLCYDGRGPVPNPIHTYLSTQYHELRNLKDEDSALKAKAKDLWYVPNPKDAAEVEKMRERALLKEYETYKTAKKIKTPRLEALRLGFQKSYEAHDYATIVAIAKKIPSDVVETDEKLLRYFDRAQLHLED